MSPKIHFATLEYACIWLILAILVYMTRFVLLVCCFKGIYYNIFRAKCQEVGGIPPNRPRPPKFILMIATHLSQYPAQKIFCKISTYYCTMIQYPFSKNSICYATTTLLCQGLCVIIFSIKCHIDLFYVTSLHSTRGQESIGDQIYDQGIQSRL